MCGLSCLGKAYRLTVGAEPWYSQDIGGVPGDRHQLIGHPGMVIMIPRNVFHKEGVALDITEGKLSLRFDLGDRQAANQEIVHAKTKRSAPPAFRAGAGAAGHCPRLFDSVRDPSITT